MSPRTGRPKSENPKEVVVRARIDDDLNNRLETYCEKHDVKKTEVVRNGIIKILDEEK